MRGVVDLVAVESRRKVVSYDLSLRDRIAM